MGAAGRHLIKVLTQINAALTCWQDGDRVEVAGTESENGRTLPLHLPC